MDCIDERNKELKELQEQSRKLYIELCGETREANISTLELKEIRKRVEKVLLRIKKEDYSDIICLFRIYILREYEEDYDFYERMSEEEYNNTVKEFEEYGWSEEDLKKDIKESRKELKKIRIMKYRFKEKYNWKKISQKVGLSERQCQRIKDEILNELILSWIKEEKELEHRCKYYF